ncbi:MAG: oxidoreductase [Ferrimicrobium sp.]
MIVKYPNLFTPLQIGETRLKNRIVSSGHDTVMVEHGQVTDQLIAYHEARAQGGVGLIVVQVAGIHESARYTSHVLMATDDSCIEGYRALARAVHKHGTVLFGQLFNPGREVMESQDGSAPVALAPSAIPNERFHVMPRELTKGLIQEIIQGYGDGASRLIRAGLDGVEIVASHGYLPAQFLNPHVNRRSDDYGGSADRRQRFLFEVLEAVRSRVGTSAVVGVRISLDEHDPYGLTEEISLQSCERLASSGLIDYLSITVGTSATLAGSDHIVPPMNMKNAYTALAANKVKRMVNIPVLVAGRINQPQEAERVLASGSADACVMTRALICDPDLPELARVGRSDDIRACIACNQACIGHFHKGYAISCIQRPETGRERLYGNLSQATPSKRVLVVGAGPGGMKAAIVASTRGHAVRLVEEKRHVGGQVLLAQKLPEREEFGGAATNLYAELRRSSVELILGVRVDMDFVKREHPDAVIVATGAKPYRPDLELDSHSVLDAWQILKGDRPPAGGKVVVLDWKGDWIGLGVARLLASQRFRVTLAVNGYAPGEGLQQYVRDSHLANLHRLGVEVLSLVRMFGVDEETVYLQHVLSKELIIVEDVAGVVLATGHQADSALLTELTASNIPSYGVGDCLAPRTVEEAILEGLTVGAQV